MSFLSFLGASRNVSPVFPAVASCSDTSARELCGEGQGGRGSSSWPWTPAGCRLPRSCRHHFVPPWATPKATTDQLAECFTAAALDRPSEKLMAVNSSRLRHIGLSPDPMSFLAPLLITPVSFLHISQGKTWRERDREKGRDGEEGVETQQSGVLSSLVPGD